MNARVCLSAVWNKGATTANLENREFWTIHQGIESIAATFSAETFAISPPTVLKGSPPIVGSWSSTPKSDHDSCENIYVNCC